MTTNNKNPRHDLTAKRENSLYYAILLKKEGKQKADRSWNKREITTKNLFYIPQPECRQIEKACDDFMAKHKLSHIGAWK